MAHQTNKVRVTTTTGSDSIRGMMDPKVNMVTNKGTIHVIYDSGNAIPFVDISGYGSDPTTLKRFHCFDLLVTEDEASGNFSWPTGDGSIVFGHGTDAPAVGTPTTGGAGASNDGTNTINTWTR